MKKIKKYTALALAALLLLASLTLLSSCGGTVRYDDADYKTGGLISDSETVKAIEIVWQSGEVKVEGVLTDKLFVMEDRLPGDDLALRYRLKDGVLSIYPCASGENAARLEKKLIVQIPYAMANALERVTVTTDSADVECSLLTTAALTVTTDSGDVSYMGGAKDATVTTVSGELDMQASGVDALCFTSVSGDADVAIQTAGFKAVMNGGSGEINFDGPISVHQSANIYSYGDQKSTLVFTTKSGEVELSLWKS
ncbi:MAG: DUF4097 family beta strand repeat protein [Clostridia bacterium]|nr:DUF4097 family beta strand repeat protein [Clostridia bacterium]